MLPRLETFQATDHHQRLLAEAARRRMIRSVLRRRRASLAANRSAEFVADLHG